MNMDWKANETDRKQIALIISLLVHIALLYGLWYADQKPSVDHQQMEQMEQRIDEVSSSFIKS